mmetsp:Transcript_18458/g.48203  ORF Transcript_18458/g.48203 Transcript_18458/m.48203 type:complete len:85 (+) Transcript_18458:109-363(+)
MAATRRQPIRPRLGAGTARLTVAARGTPVARLGQRHGQSSASSAKAAGSKSSASASASGHGCGARGRGTRGASAEGWKKARKKS